MPEIIPLYYYMTAQKDYENSNDIKYHLCKAAIIGIKMLKKIDPYCKIILVEPLVKIHPIDARQDVWQLNEYQFQHHD